LRAQERGAAAGDDPFFHGRAGRVQGVIDAGFLFLAPATWLYTTTAGNAQRFLEKRRREVCRDQHSAHTF